MTSSKIHTQLLMCNRPISKLSLLSVFLQRIEHCIIPGKVDKLEFHIPVLLSYFVLFARIYQLEGI